MQGHLKWVRIAAVATVGLWCCGIGWAQDSAPTPEQIKQLEDQQKQVDTKAAELAKQVHDAKVAALKAKKSSAPVANSDMQFNIPRLAKSPVIDGVINDDEWASAIVVPDAGYGGITERPISVFYFGYDDDNFYMAQKYFMLPGEKPIRYNRAPKHDLVGYGETCVELYIDRKSPGSHSSKCRWQFMGNASGNLWEREDQYEIGQNFLGWNGEWTYKQRVNPDTNVWETEMSVPKKTVYQTSPFKDGDIWWIGMATDPMSSAITWAGWYSWSIPATFDSNMPKVSVTNLEKCVKNDAKKMAFDLDVNNTTAKPFAAKAVARITDPRSETLAEATKDISLAPGEKLNWNPDVAVDKAQDKVGNKFVVMVLKDDKSVYTWTGNVSYKHPDNKRPLDLKVEAEPWNITCNYAPLTGYIKMSADKYDLPDRDQVKKAVFTVTPAEKTDNVCSIEADDWSYESLNRKIDLPKDLPAGKYDATVTLVDATGKTLHSRKAQFEKKDLKSVPWLNNTIGEDDIVLKPFEPLKMKGQTIYGYKKEITLNGAALPRTIKARDYDLLASPIAIKGVANGQAFDIQPLGSPKKGKVSETQVNYTGTGAGGPLQVSADYHLEYDGTAKIKLKLTPFVPGKPAKLDKLQMVIPFTKEASTYFMCNGQNMRLANKCGKIPGADMVGTVWTSKDVPYQTLTVGNFIPIVFIGNRSAGLEWFAANDKGWWPSDKPAIEIVRTTDGRVDLVFNFASEQVTLSEPREITFGLSVIPARPVSDYISAVAVPGFGFEEETGKWDRSVTKDDVYARVYPDNMTLWNKVNAAAQAVHERIHPYTESSQADMFEADNAYFGPDWPCYNESLIDYKLYYTEKWIKEGNLDGYYMDNFFCRTINDADAGDGYYLPDGRVQPGYDLWGQREYVKRLRTVYQKYRPAGTICIHNTEWQFSPCLAFADYVMGGEMQTPWMGGPDWMDQWSREYMDVQFNQYLWNYHLGHLYHTNDNTYVDDLGNPDQKAQAKMHRNIQADFLVHGLEHFGNSMADYQILKKQGLEFTPSWEAKGLLKVADDDPEVDTAIYQSKDKGTMLVIVSNYGKSAKNAQVWLDFPKLINVPAPLEVRIVRDFETGVQNSFYLKDTDKSNEVFGRIGWFNSDKTIRIPNTLQVRVEPRDFRIIEFINVPAAQATGF